MKFYEPDLMYIGTGEYGPVMKVDSDGEWATRDDAEQAAKDAVEMALLAQRKIYELYDGKPAYIDDPSYIEAQTIIERY